jgi:hypothetical protein
MRFLPSLIGFSFLISPCPAAAQQIDVPRIESMPAIPADYHLVDWDKVASRYDSLVFDLNASGTYYPLAALYSGTANYPEHGAFGIETYVGSGNEVPGEAINVLPALIGGTFAGANKRMQFGQDWVLRAEEFFNRRDEENVYLNDPATSSGSDWWYDTMPNVFFYQLRGLYPGTGHFDEQFTLVADQWLEAVGALGGSAAPWSLPTINYRAFSLATMSPLTSGVPEPEAAGAIAWLLYSAYHETGEERYRIGAEQAMEALAESTQNPSYELQLPYGTLAAARMNAETGTTFDIEKLLSWSFDVGPLRNWGTLVGTWGGYSVDGLVGEAGSNGYAFALNGFQQAAALVPVVRYDDRFARAIGRWMVNLASASRLFYPPYLPSGNQDSEEWSEIHDPKGVIAHEALRQYGNAASPYATGDAISAGWAPTNLALYASSSVGYLAAIVDSTEVPGVLRLNLRRTDAYLDSSWASYLVYNPHASEQIITVPLDVGSFDVYDAAADAFLARGVMDSAVVTIPPDAARVLVFPAAGGAETLVGGRLAVNGVVVDYRHGDPGNHPPRVKALVAVDSTLSVGQSTTLYCTGADAEGVVTLGWMASVGTIVQDGGQAMWSADVAVEATVTCIVSDEDGAQTSAVISITVVENQAPDTPVVTADPSIVDEGGTTTLTCFAADPDGDEVAYTWATEHGYVDGAGQEIQFTAPDLAGYWRVDCIAFDPDGLSTAGSVYVTSGRLILDLGLNGGAADASGFGNDGVITGATSASGRGGLPNTAVYFDGIDDVVVIPAHPVLNPLSDVSISVWVHPESLPNREAFVISHGSWQNRWKLSLTPGGVPRWTVKTAAGVEDLDADSALAVGTFTHLAATFDGVALRLYVDGELEGERSHTGSMPATQLPLLIGQMLPGQTDYNFHGIIDDIRVYNDALSAPEVMALFTDATATEPDPPTALFTLGDPWPNPSSGHMRFVLDLPRAGHVAVRVFDILGRAVGVVQDGSMDAGRHTLEWDATAYSGSRVASGVYFIVATDGEKSQIRRVFVVG